MENTDSENGSSDEQISTKKPQKVPWSVALWRYDEDGTYNNNPQIRGIF
jgi:hypothetical protein